MLLWKAIKLSQNHSNYTKMKLHIFKICNCSQHGYFSSPPFSPHGPYKRPQMTRTTALTITRRRRHGVISTITANELRGGWSRSSTEKWPHPPTGRVQATLPVVPGGTWQQSSSWRRLQFATREWLVQRFPQSKDILHEDGTIAAHAAHGA
jgi:hypothetical protein